MTRTRVASAVGPPAGATPEALLAEGPDASLGAALTRDIRMRAATTRRCGLADRPAHRLTGTPARASTVALVAMVGAQLGQTGVAGQLDPTVTAACLASLALMAVAVQTPGLSHLLGSRPLGPFGWATAAGAATASAGVAWWLTRSADGQHAAHQRDRERGEKSGQHLGEDLDE